MNTIVTVRAYYDAMSKCSQAEKDEVHVDVWDLIVVRSSLTVRLPLTARRDETSETPSNKDPSHPALAQTHTVNPIPLCVASRNKETFN